MSVQNVLVLREGSRADVNNGEDAGNRLVEEMDYMLGDLEPLSSFVLPTGNPVVAHLHMARTIVRRAEREACGLRKRSELRL